MFCMVVLRCFIRRDRPSDDARPRPSGDACTDARVSLTRKARSGAGSRASRDNTVRSRAGCGQKPNGIRGSIRRRDWSFRESRRRRQPADPSSSPVTTARPVIARRHRRLASYPFPRRRPSHGHHSVGGATVQRGNGKPVDTVHDGHRNINGFGRAARLRRSMEVLVSGRPSLRRIVTAGLSRQLG